ncbi:hypothetical protein P170DRAFT_483705 [Aspergillus steynii IBT 23096]|uniref:Cell wall mannoprotein 1 n=1 Tax=Aspergillus steynii IBT 23096 TaxID=1392250 RepID=A0A2I2GPV6_9EURO|nr:uncharacterized protein P170DRAFT_483705 [Aspergillus steynii IBT 23096]PLB54906.1 hypothetical protein P170DRAFT_483705 [Aspergillus steynii IBT 23096]
MKFAAFSILTLGLTSGALAQPTRVERDLPTVTGVLSGIGPKVEALDSAVQAYSGGDVAKVQQASDNLVDAINAGTTKVKGTSDLSTSDALGLPGPVNELKDKISTVITHLSSKKSQLVKAGKGGQTYSDLTEQKTAAKKLSDTIVSKVPDSLQDLAGSIASGISEAIQKGVKEFQDQEGKGSSGSSSGSSGSSSFSSSSSDSSSSKQEQAPKKEAAPAPAPSSDSAAASKPAPSAEPAPASQPAPASKPVGACAAAY